MDDLSAWKEEILSEILKVWRISLQTAKILKKSGILILRNIKNKTIRIVSKSDSVFEVAEEVAVAFLRELDDVITKNPPLNKHRIKGKKKFQEFTQKWQKSRSKKNQHLHELLLDKPKITRNLRGYTKHSNIVADLIEKDKIRIKILTDDFFYKELVEKYGYSLEEAKAFNAYAIGNRTYFKETTSTQSFFSELVHEGSHVRDYLEVESMMKRRIPRNKQIDIIGKQHRQEKRAFYRERAYQVATGMETLTDDIIDLFTEIERVYNDVWGF